MHKLHWVLDSAILTNWKKQITTVEWTTVTKRKYVTVWKEGIPFLKIGPFIFIRTYNSTWLFDFVVVVTMSLLLKVSHLSGDIYECRPLFVLNKINNMMEMNVIYATGSMINIASINTGCSLYVFEGHSSVVTSMHVFNANSNNINKLDYNDGIEIISTSLDGVILIWKMVS